jgi:hypothetical protein
VAKEMTGRGSFFSFGTNDLIQTICGLNCDVAEGGFLAEYLEEGILQKHPFETSTGTGSAGSYGRPAKGAVDQSQSQAGHLRRAWRRSREHLLFLRGGPRLRLLLALPNAGRPSRRRASSA